MHVEVGPLPSASALAWLDYAAAVLSSDQRTPTAGDDLPGDVVESFASYIGEWYQEAMRGPEFLWVADVPEELAEYLVLAFYRIVQRLAKGAEARGAPMSPPAGQTFYVMLVRGLLDALAAEGPGPAEFSDHLKSFWPGLEL